MPSPSGATPVFGIPYLEETDAPDVATASEDMALAVETLLVPFEGSTTPQWTSFTPTWQASGTAPSLGNGTLTGYYKKIGRQVAVRINLTAGSTTTYGTGSLRLRPPTRRRGIRRAVPPRLLQRRHARMDGARGHRAVGHRVRPLHQLGRLQRRPPDLRRQPAHDGHPDPPDPGRLRERQLSVATIFDAVDVPAIPADAQTILAYIDGGYVTYAAVKARFPNARILTVTTNGKNRADICDVESGDATPAIAAAGVRAGLYPTVYSALSTRGALTAALWGLEWNWYAADPTGVPHIVPGSVATQYAWPGYGSPGNYDISLAEDAWLNPPAPPPPPTPQETDVLIASTPNGGYWCLTLSNGAVYAYGDAQYHNGLNNAGPNGTSALVPGDSITGFAGHANSGYWITTAQGHVYAFGSASFLGAP